MPPDLLLLTRPSRPQRTPTPCSLVLLVARYVTQRHAQKFTQLEKTELIGIHWVCRNGELAPFVLNRESSSCARRWVLSPTCDHATSLPPSLVESSPLRSEVCRGVDFNIIRELTGGIYFGERKEDDGSGFALDTEPYSRAEIERITRLGAHLALQHNPPSPRVEFGQGQRS